MRLPGGIASCNCILQDLFNVKAARSCNCRALKKLQLQSSKYHYSAIHLWGRSGRGHCRKISAKFPRNFRTLSWRNKTYFSANFRECSAEFPQTFRKNPFANDPISELLNYTQKQYRINSKTISVRKFLHTNYRTYYSQNISARDSAILWSHFLPRPSVIPAHTSY